MVWMLFASKLSLLIKIRFKTLNDNFRSDRNKKKVSMNLMRMVEERLISSICMGYRVVEAGRHFQLPCSKHVQLQQVTQDCVQLGFEYL